MDISAVIDPNLEPEFYFPLVLAPTFDKEPKKQMSSAHSEPRAFCYPSNPSSSQERVNPNPLFKKKKFGLYWFGGDEGS